MNNHSFIQKQIIKYDIFNNPIKGTIIDVEPLSQTEQSIKGCNYLFIVQFENGHTETCDPEEVEFV